MVFIRELDTVRFDKAEPFLIVFHSTSALLLKPQAETLTGTCSGFTRGNVIIQ